MFRMARSMHKVNGMRTFRPDKKGEKGLSLIELLVVCTIIGILLSVANASYHQFYLNLASKGFANAVLAKAQEAQRLTRSLSRNIDLAADLDNEAVWIEVDGEMHGAKVAPALAAIGISGIHFASPVGSFATSGVYRFIFTTSGTIRIEPNLGATAIGWVMHTGPKNEPYNTAAAVSAEFQTIWFQIITANASKYDVGCVGNNPWMAHFTPPWPNCDQL